MNKQLNGRHYETGSIQNALALGGIKAPHTGIPYSEALLLGISGGITFGYFTFEYEGYLPHLALLTRNTFDSFETILERLGIPQDVRQTGKAEIAEKSLVDALETGLFPIVWADQFGMPYNDYPYDEGMWGMIPVVVVGVEGDMVAVADRSSQALHLTMDQFTKARGRVKKDKYRFITLDAPKPAKLASAVSNGIYQCIQLYTEKPPKGARYNFGFAAYKHLADMLVNTRNKNSWERFFAPGIRMYHALAGSVGQPGAYSWIQTWGSDQGADRGTYADFLVEAAEILSKPALEESANLFQASKSMWITFAESALPDDVSLLGESKKLIQRKHDLFVEQGDSVLDEIKEINAGLNEIKKQAEADFPISGNEGGELRENLREQILKIRDKEKDAVESLQSAVM